MRVGVISCDYDGTLAGAYELRFEDGKKRFNDDIEKFKNKLFLIKEYEKLDIIVFSLNTNEGNFETVTYALQEIFKGVEWLIPGIQFLGADCYFYDVEAHFGKPVTKYYQEIYNPGDKINNLINYVLIMLKEKETVISVTHIEDGKNYDSNSLKRLNELGIDTYIINTPVGTNRRTMINGLVDTIPIRIENCKKHNIDKIF